MRRSSVILSLTLLCLVVILTPMAGNYLARRELLVQVSEARQLFIAIQSAALDRKATGAGGTYPVESGVRSTAAYLGLLQKENYWQGKDRVILGNFVIANVSENDPPDTVFILSRNAYQALRAGQAPRNFIVFLKNGEGASFKAGVNGFFKLPPRQPAFLEP
jgi:hypothetical protein